MSTESHRTWLMPIVAPAFLARILEPVRETARVKGYAIAIHGSLARDLDLVAIPWTGQASAAEELVAAVFDVIRARLEGAGYMPEDQRGNAKPHGRRAWTIILGSGVYVDFSVMPRVAEVAP